MSGTRRGTFLPYAQPTIGEEEIAEVVDSLRSGWVTTGPKVQRFESDCVAYLGARHAIAVSSCTAGLQIALAALGIGPGDEVIVPTLTFCSTANVVVHLGARPVFVDVGSDCNISPMAAEAAIGPRTRAIVPVHFGGQACDLDAIYGLAARHRLAVVEDAAHAVGATYHGWKLGSSALAEELILPAGVRAAAVFSFYATKNMTTGEGGLVTTVDDTLAERMRLLTLHGMNRDAWKRYTRGGSWYYEVVEAGYKANMGDIQAAIGIHQLRKLDTFIATRRRYARLFDEAFANLTEVETPRVHPDRCHIYHLYPILIDSVKLSIDRAVFITRLRDFNIGSSVHFIPVHLHPFYQCRYDYQAGDFPTAEALYERIISLPLYPGMSETDVCDVVDAVRELVGMYRR